MKLITFCVFKKTAREQWDRRYETPLWSKWIWRERKMGKKRFGDFYSINNSLDESLALASYLVSYNLFSLWHLWQCWFEKKSFLNEFTITCLDKDLVGKQRKRAGYSRNKLYWQIYQPAPLNTSLWNYCPLPSALENGLQQRTIWTGWQDGSVLEENTLEPNSNRFDPSNGHLSWSGGPGRHTQPQHYLLSCSGRLWERVPENVSHFLITRTNK